MIISFSVEAIGTQLWFVFFFSLGGMYNSGTVLRFSEGEGFV